MLRTRICELLGIEHPIVLGGLGSATSPELVAAVCAAGAFGVLGATRQSPEEVARDAAAIRAATGKLRRKLIHFFLPFRPTARGCTTWCERREESTTPMEACG